LVTCIEIGHMRASSAGHVLAQLPDRDDLT
jgi:hypothetical protein